MLVHRVLSGRRRPGQHGAAAPTLVLVNGLVAVLVAVAIEALEFLPDGAEFADDLGGGGSP